MMNPASKPPRLKAKAVSVSFNVLKKLVALPVWVIFSCLLETILGAIYCYRGF